VSPHQRGLRDYEHSPLTSCEYAVPNVITKLNVSRGSVWSVVRAYAGSAGVSRSRPRDLMVRPARYTDLELDGI
jgi:hypothetical protein